MNNNEGTIGLVVWNLYGGGTQRVTTQLSLTLKEVGFKVIIFTLHPEFDEEFPHACDDRKQFWFLTGTDEELRAVVVHYKLDCIVFNDAWNDDRFNHVVRLLKNLGVKVVCVNHHAPTNWSISLNNIGDFERDSVKADIDLFIAVNPVQAICWHSRGYKTVCLQNPIGIEIPKENPYRHCHQLIWIGRNDPFKRLPLMLSCFLRIKEYVNDATLLIVGGFTEKEKKEMLAKVKSSHKDSIKFLGYLSKIETCFFDAGAHVCTSALECTTPQIILESSSYGVPTVMFELPMCMDAVRENGIVSILDDSIDDFAREVAKILKEKEYAHSLSNRAFSFGVSLPLQAIRSSWGHIFLALMKNNHDPIEANVRSFLSIKNYNQSLKEIYRGEKYFVEHYFYIIKVWQKWQFRLTKLKKLFLHIG